MRDTGKNLYEVERCTRCGAVRIDLGTAKFEFTSEREMLEAERACVWVKAMPRLCEAPETEIRKSVEERKEQASDIERNCRNCAIGREIMDTLDASEGTVDLSEELCEGCVQHSKWQPLKKTARIKG